MIENRMFLRCDHCGPSREWLVRELISYGTIVRVGDGTSFVGGIGNFPQVSLWLCSACWEAIQKEKLLISLGSLSDVDRDLFSPDLAGICFTVKNSKDDIIPA
jgi:hypothetical protein